MCQFSFGSLIPLLAVCLGAFLYHYYTEQRSLKEKKLQVLGDLQRILKMLVDYAALLTQAHYQCNYFRRANEIKPDAEAWKLLIKYTDDVARIAEKMTDWKGEMTKDLFLYRLYFGKDDPLFNLINEIKWNDIEKFEYKHQYPNLDALLNAHKENMKNVFDLTRELVGKKVEEISKHLDKKAAELN